MQRGWRLALGAAAVWAFTAAFVLFPFFIGGGNAGGAGIGRALVFAAGVLVVALVVSAVPLATFFVWWHVRRRAMGKEALPPARELPAPIETLDPETTDDVAIMAEVDGPFTACPECGYLGVRFPGIRDALWPGGGETGGRFVCARCHYQGLPIEFESGDAYAAFVRGLHGAST